MHNVDMPSECSDLKLKTIIYLFINSFMITYFIYEIDVFNKNKYTTKLLNLFYNYLHTNFQTVLQKKIETTIKNQISKSMELFSYFLKLQFQYNKKII